MDADHRGRRIKKFLAVMRQNWRLLDQSKNAFLPTPPAFGIGVDPVGIL